MPFFTRPHFEDRQIIQSNDESIQLSGVTKIGPTLLDFTGTTTAQTTVTIMGVTGYLNGGREYGFQIQPPILKISGSTGYTTTDVTGYVLTSIDSGGTVSWASVASLSADTNTYVTGGTLNGSNQLILDWNNGGSASAIDLSALSDTTYWTAGTSGTGSIRVTNGGGTNATGNYAVAQGFDTKAIGSFSHSEGKNTSAVGVGSHSEGIDTIASGITSHAEGQGTTASGNYSHSEGFQTIASGVVSHTEGLNTTASGAYSHSEGRQTTASGDYSHAEGYQSTASGILSHAEGSGIASGTLSHAEGGATVASGSSSHSEGSGTIASGDYSHSEGENTIASGDRSHAEGFETTASGLGSHSEGYQTIASGTYSHAGGQGSIVSGTDSFIHSTNSLINGARSVLLGGQNLTGTTSDTVYVPNLTVREDYILHSDSTLEVVDIPSTFENLIKGSYTEFNWDGITTSLLNNNNPSGSTTFLLGDFSTYPTIKNHGFLSYYGTGYTRTGSPTPTTGTDFYRNKMVLKIAEDSDGTVFSNASTTSWWWENDGFSRMKLTSDGLLGIGLNTNGTESPSANLQIGGTSTTGSFKYIDGNQQSGYVLTSDSNGSANWTENPLGSFMAAKAPEAISVHPLTAKGIPDGQVISGYTSIFYNHTDISGTLTTDFGTFNNNTGIFTTNTDCVLNIQSWIHLKADTSSTVAWETGATPTQIGLGICPNNATDINVGNFLTILPSISRGLDISTGITLRATSGTNFRVKVLNQTSRVYPGSGVVSGDYIRFSITRIA